MQFKFSPKVLDKLQTSHGVKQQDVFECFFNRTASFLVDTREDNRTNPETQWFISETDVGTKLKVCFIHIGSELIIKTTYPPNPEEIRIYDKYAQCVA